MITKAIYIEDYKVEVYFNSGEVRVIDLNKFLRESTHPLITKYRNKALFENFKVEFGTICWENDFDLNPENILLGKYDAQPHLQA